MSQPVLIRLQELAESIGARLKGDPDCKISGLASLEKAKSSEIAFLTNRQYRKYLATTQASAVLLSAQDLEDCPVNALVTENPRLSLAKLAGLFLKVDAPSKEIHPTAIIGQNCHIASTASIGAHTVIENGVKIGEDVIIGSGCYIGQDSSLGAKTILKSHVTLYDNIHLGARCLIHSGAVIGSDGFGYAHDQGNWIKMPHLGGVRLGDDVEIGANTTIDRGFLEDTLIGDGVIIDNLVQVGHNVSIGARTAIAACVAIAGSTSIGEYCLIGGGTCIAGHLQITDRVSLTAMSGINHSINTPGVYSSGLPAKPNHVWRKNAARFQYLDEMAKRLRALEKAVPGFADKAEQQ